MLCEKSITLNAKELEEAKQLAEEKWCRFGGGNDDLSYAFV